MKTYNLNLKQKIKSSYRQATAKKIASKHNDLSYDEELKKRATENIYITRYGNDVPFEEALIKTYEELYSDKLAYQNEKALKRRHKDDVKTMKEYAEAHPPLELLFQVGKRDDEIPRDLQIQFLMNSFNRWSEEFNEWNEAHGFPFAFISGAVHLHEGSPHIQVLFAPKGKDKNGFTVPSKDSALELAGVKRPDVTKKKNKWNNANITFTELNRNMWLNIVEDEIQQYYQLDRKPQRRVVVTKDGKEIERAAKHKPTWQYLQQLQENLIDSYDEAKAELESKEVELESKEAELESKESIIDEKIKETEKTLKMANLKLTEVSEKEADAIQRIKEVNKRLAYAGEVLRLSEELDSYQIPKMDYTPDL